MKKYRVTMVRIENRIFEYEVEAEDQDQAIEMAEELLDQANTEDGEIVHAEEFENGVEEITA
jgi:hypothetical protein